MERRVVHDQVSGAVFRVGTLHGQDGNVGAVVQVELADRTIGAGFDLRGLSEYIHALVAAHAELKAHEAARELEDEAGRAAAGDGDVGSPFGAGGAR